MKSIRGLALTLTLSVLGVAACSMGDMMPNPPTDLKAEPLSGGAHLTWKDNSDNESAFMIQRMAGTAAYMDLTSVPFDTTAYHDPNLAAGTYMYRVMAMPKSGTHETGSGKYSNEVTFTAP